MKTYKILVEVVTNTEGSIQSSFEDTGNRFEADDASAAYHYTLSLQEIDGKCYAAEEVIET